MSSNLWNSLLNSLVTVTSGCMERKERTRCINILTMKIYHINCSNNIKNIKMLIKAYITALKRFCIFSNLLIRRYTHYKWVNWCSCAMLPWKKVVLIFLHQKWLGLAVMGKYHSKHLMLLNLAFLMKCKYTGTIYLKAVMAFHSPRRGWSYIVYVVSWNDPLV